MQGQVVALSATANPALPRRPELEGRIAHVRCGRRNTATPAVALRAAQELRADRRYRRLREGVRDGNLRSSPILFVNSSHANRRTERSRHSRATDLVRYPTP